MLIWIPVDREDPKDAQIVPVAEVASWALVEFDAGEVKSVRFYDNHEAFGEWVDFVILANAFEPYIDYMNEGMMVLCVREERTIEEIMEAYKFKELDEVGF